MHATLPSHLVFRAADAAPRFSEISAEATLHPQTRIGRMKAHTEGTDVVLTIDLDRITTAERARRLIAGRFGQFGFAEEPAVSLDMNDDVTFSEATA